jgi:hypothetical protein
MVLYEVKLVLKLEDYSNLEWWLAEAIKQNLEGSEELVKIESKEIFGYWSDRPNENDGEDVP